MRGPSAVIPAARVLHDRLIALGLHPDPPLYTAPEALRTFTLHTSPCDGCVDLAEATINAYAVTWQGPRATQS